jgi:hypothetical protein
LNVIFTIRTDTKKNLHTPARLARLPIRWEDDIHSGHKSITGKKLSVVSREFGSDRDLKGTKILLGKPDGIFHRLEF